MGGASCGCWGGGVGGLAIVLCFERVNAWSPRTAAYAICLDVALRNLAVKAFVHNRRACFECNASSSYGYMPIRAKSMHHIREVSNGKTHASCHECLAADFAKH